MKSSAKALVNALAVTAAYPAYVLYRLGACVGSPGQSLASWSQFLGLWPGNLGVYLRRGFYRLALAQCGQDAFIGFGVLVTHPATKIGKHAYVGPYGVLGEVILEDDVLLGSQVSITNGSRQHGIERLDMPVREQPGVWPRVTIGQDTWIGDRAVVMADVGRHCVIGAGAVVTKPIPDYAIAVGCPARVVGDRRHLAK